MGKKEARAKWAGRIVYIQFYRIKKLVINKSCSKMQNDEMIYKFKNACGKYSQFAHTIMFFTCIYKL